MSKECLASVCVYGVPEYVKKECLGMCIRATGKYDQKSANEYVFKGCLSVCIRDARATRPVIHVTSSRALLELHLVPVDG